jgi:YD repeat-containing protein
VRKSTCLVCFAAALLPPAIEIAHAGTVASQLSARQPVSISGVNGTSEQIFGEMIDPKTGSTSFSFTDVSIPTNSALKVEVGRRLVVSGSSFELRDSNDDWGGVVGGLEPEKDVFGSYWELDIPYMEATWDARTGWMPANRCSAASFQQPGVMGLWPFYSSHYDAKTYASGIKVHIPGKGTESLLTLAAGAPVPSNNLTYVGATASGARFSCLTTLKNDNTSEGFLATLPDGTKYWFDWMATKRKPSIMSGGSMGTSSQSNLTPSSDTVSPQTIVPLLRAYLMVTRIEDRFGNALTYTYDSSNPNRLISIASNDLASAQLNYNASGQISTIEAAGRTWTYIYSGSQLQNVVLPDNSKWEYSGVSTLTRLFADRETDVLALQKHCIINLGTMVSSANPDIGDYASITMTAPSGAQGTFKFREIVHGDSRAPGSCVDTKFEFAIYNSTGYEYMAVMEGAPLLNRVASIYARELSGPGLQLLRWTYKYFPAWSYLSACTQPTSCVTTTTTEVTAPDGTVTTYLFGNDYGVNSGSLLQTTVTRGGVVATTTSQTKVASAGGYCFPDSLGTDPFPLSNPLYTKNRPILSTSTSLDGATFNSTVQSFDCMARPLQTKKWSTGMTINFQKTDAVQYSDNLAKWVLGQVKSMTNTDTGTVVSETAYNATTALPTANYSFGLLQQSMAYNTNGTLKSVTDANNRVTTFSDYRRGVAQSLTFADGRPTRTIVDDNGWVTSSTDQLGSTTSYTYDGMGRPSRIIHPSGDPVVWNDTIGSFVPVAADEYGIAAGHWKQVVQTGKGKTTSYYDAQWRQVLALSEDTDNAATKSFVVNRYDTAGRLMFSSYPVGSLTTVNDTIQGVRTEYDALGRVTKVLQDSELGVLTSTSEYLNGFQLKTTNPRLIPTTTSYQAFDSPDTGRPVLIQAPEGEITTITRDVLGRPLTVTRTGPAG